MVEVADAETLLQLQVIRFVKEAGSYRKAAKMLRVTAPYVLRLAQGKKDNPNAYVLRRLGLQRTFVYAPEDDLP